MISQLESIYSLVVMITFVLLFCCVLVGPARRRKRFTQVIGVTENQSPNQSYINQAFENYDDTFISEHNTDGIILKALPDYGELKVNLHYSTMESDLLNSLAWDNFFVFGSLGLYCGIIYPIVPLSHSRGRLLWDNGSMG